MCVCKCVIVKYETLEMPNVTKQAKKVRENENKTPGSNANASAEEEKKKRNPPLETKKGECAVTKEPPGSPSPNDAGPSVV